MSSQVRYRSWTKPALENALDAVEHGCTVNGAAKQFGVPEATVRYHAKGM